MVFSSGWKKKKREKNGVEIGNGLLPIEHEARRWAGRWAGVGAGGRAGRWALGAGARGWRADGRAGLAGAGRGQRRQRGRRAAAALGHADGRGAQALGRAGERHSMGPRSLGGRTAGRPGARAWAWAAATRGARGRRRQGLAGRPAGRPVRVWCAQLGQVGCFGAPDSVFGLV